MKPIRILYFDDEKWLSETLQKNLQETYSQYQINLVSSIKQFIDELNGSEKYDLIIMDIMAPMSLVNENEEVKKLFSDSEIKGMSDGSNMGEVLFKKVRTIKPYSETPILFLSAKRMANIQDNYTAFLRKPEIVNVINDKIKYLIGDE